jgi:hypothetical protein
MNLSLSLAAKNPELVSYTSSKWTGIEIFCGILAMQAFLWFIFQRILLE